MNTLLRFRALMLCGLAIGLSLAQGSAAGVGVGPSFKGPIGLQLYSLRDLFKSDVPGTLEKVKGYGVHDVELASNYGLPAEKFKEMLTANNLNPVSAHYPYEQYRDDPESVAKEANVLGLKYVGCAWIPHEGNFTEKTCREAIAVFNHAGEVLAKHGLKFFYHVHGYEFQPFGQGTLLDLLITETKPKEVSYQMDIFWIVFPGQDPVKLLEKYGSRWQLMHLKDMKKGLQTGSLSGGTDVRNDVPLGTGQIDLPPLLRAAKKAGVKYYFIEDESPLAPGEIPDSLRYLETVKF